MKRPICIVAVVIATAAILYCIFLYRYDILNVTEGEVLTLSGQVVQKKITQDKKVIYIRTLDRSDKIRGILCCYQMGDIPNIGDWVKVTGTAAFFDRARNPGQFNEAAYYEVRGYNLILYDTAVTVTEHTFNTIPEALYRLKQRCLETIQKSFPKEYGSIQAILLADKTNFADERETLYRNAGISHFFVISGLHISLLCGAVYLSLRKLGISLGKSAAAGILCIVLYGFLLGFGVSVFRACIMYVIRILSDLYKRSYDMFTSLAVAAIMVLVNQPLWITDASFCLSYTAVLSIAIYSEVFSKRRENAVKQWKNVIWEGFRMPLFIFLMLLPVSLWFFFMVSLKSVVANVVVGMVMTPFLLISTCGLGFGLLGMHGISYAMDEICFIILKFVDCVCTLLSGRTGIILGKMQPVAMIIYYVLILLAWVTTKLPVMLRVVLILTALTLPGLGRICTMEITILDVGQGECICVRDSPTTATLIDCGSTSEKDIGIYILLPFLKSQGIRHIKDIYVTHGDEDHCNGIGQLIEASKSNGIRIDRLIISPNTLSIPGDVISDVIETAKGVQIPICLMSTGEQISYRDYFIFCLWPQEKLLYQEANYASMVLHLKYNNFDMLLTGDINAEAESMIADMEDNEKSMCYDVLKVAHHGSAASSEMSFLKSVNPIVAVISCGLNNRYGHPSPRVLSDLENLKAKVYITKDNGAIRICTDGKNMIQLSQYVNTDSND